MKSRLFALSISMALVLSLAGCGKTATMDFSDAKMTEYVYNSDGSVREEKVSYTDGSGTAALSSGRTTALTASKASEDVSLRC